MTSSAKRKGDAAEREFANILTDLLGFPVSRSLGAGRAQDRGDLFGIPDTVIQVAAWDDARRAAREKPADAEFQRANAGATFAATAVRFNGGTWRVVLTPEQYATYVREALA
jgi:Holliday junction resolvase